MDFDFSSIINQLTEIYKTISGYIYDEHPLLGFIANIVTIGTPVYLIISWLGPKLWKKKEIDKLGEIDDNYTLNLVKSRKYIQTMGQLEPPHENESAFISTKRFSLINHILKDIFNKKDESDVKRYMVLGGSGMGKSTFSAALYYRYIHKYNFKKSPYPIFIKSLSDPNIISELNELNSLITKKSIIILDALDENIEAAQDVSAFIDELEKATSKFSFVIITCRTQFFDDEDSEPNELKIKKKWGPIRRLKYEKIFISPFTEKEAKKYLRRKYGFINRKYQKAVTIVTKKCWDALSRPMILSFIDDLLELDNVNDVTPIEIYSKIIDKWFEHENEIQDINKSVLYSFSKSIAVFMYNKWVESQLATISAEDYRLFLIDNGYEKSPYSFKARSLINRRGDGAIKFSHRSFWEFFLAIYSYENPGKSFIGNGLSMAKGFVEDLCELKLKGRTINYVCYDYNRLSILTHPISPINELMESLSFIHNNLNEQDNYESMIYRFWELSLNRTYNMNKLNTVYVYRDIVIHRNNMSILVRRKREPSYMIRKRSYNVRHIEMLLMEMAENEFSIIHTVQNCFNLLDNKFLLQKSIKRTLDLLSEIKKTEKLFNTKTRKEIVDDNDIYIHHPNTIHWLNPVPNSKCLFLATGFNSDSTILNYVQMLSKQVNLLVILRDDDDVNSLVSFISHFKDIELKCSIILNLLMNNKVVNYFLDSETKCYDTSTIRTVLQNMIKSKSQMDTI